MYISLKEGWMPLSDLCLKYGKDKGNMNKALDRIGDQDKEKVGNTWIVRESIFAENIKTDIEYKQPKEEEIKEIIDKFTNKLVNHVPYNIVRTKFSVQHYDTDYILQVFLEWAVKCQIEFPMKIYEYIKDEKLELYTKFTLIQQMYNKALKKKGDNKHGE